VKFHITVFCYSCQENPSVLKMKCKYWPQYMKTSARFIVVGNKNLS